LTSYTVSSASRARTLTNYWRTIAKTGQQATVAKTDHETKTSLDSLHVVAEPELWSVSPHFAVYQLITAVHTDSELCQHGLN